MRKFRNPAALCLPCDVPIRAGLPELGRYGSPTVSTSNGAGPLGLPPGSRPLDERAHREKLALASIDARLEAGLLCAEDADIEILELALARLSFLPDEVIEELRAFGRELHDEPEMVESRTLAPRPGNKSSR